MREGRNEAVNTSVIHPRIHDEKEEKLLELFSLLLTF
jgi:hypothetical protein